MCLVRGSAGLLAILGCLNKTAQTLHVFGFNWSRASYALHQMEAEEILAMQLFERFAAVLHPVPCARKYSCDPECDVNGYSAMLDGESPGCREKVRARAFPVHHSICSRFFLTPVC